MPNRTIAFCLGLWFAMGVPLTSAQPYERTVQDTVSMQTSTISLENKEGSITVSTWSRDVVSYRARIVSEEIEEAVQQTRIDVNASAESLSLATNYDDVEGQWMFGPKSFGYVKTEPEVHYTLRVPESASLRISDHESDVDVSGLSGALQIDTHEGGVRVTDQSGRAEVSSHEGRIVMREVSGNLIVDSHEGSVTVEGLRGPLDLQTHEGRAEVRIEDLKEIVAGTHDGSVILSVPASGGFDLSTDLEDDAEFQSDADLTSIQRGEGEYQGAVRGGGPLLRLSSQEGRITLQSQ